MTQSEQEFLQELRKAFAVEAGEHLQTMVGGLIDIEKKKDPADHQTMIETVYRAAHSLKGAARSVNMPAIGAVCQSLENVFSAMKKGLLTLEAGDFDTLHRAMDSISRILASPAGEGEVAVDALREELDRMAAAGKGPSDPTHSWVGTENRTEPDPAGAGQTSNPQEREDAAAATAAADLPAMSGTVRVAAAKLDAILLQAEELISVKLAGEQRISELGDILALVGRWKKEWEKAGARARAANARKSETGPPRTDSEGAALLASFDWSYSRLLEAEARLEGLRKALRSDLRSAGLLVDRLLESTKTGLLQPFSTLLRVLPKMVRDISRDQGKEVDLVVNGGEIEVDKRILERMKDPLIHLVRNSIDHGIEKADVRRAHNKPAAGTISIRISQVEGNKVQILVVDDGSGIDPVRILKNAVTRGLLSPEDADALDDASALQLIFQSGVSTADIITDISGRGLGMAIVKEAVDRLGGGISFETRKEKGATFRICLPQTLATFRGLLLREYGRIFAVPTSSVERALRIRQEKVGSVENRETIPVEGATLPLVRLGGLLGLDPGSEGREEPDPMTVVILNAGQTRMAFAVDDILNEQEILIKGLGKQLVRVRNITGATILGSGQVIPVLNVDDLMRSAVRAAKTASTAPRTAPATAKRRAALVVEDSITARMLLKNILASAGFDVHAVVDGIEAWTALQERPFDVVVSDVEMPGMNGFDLTAKIRGESKWADLPVVLVTALESRQDRERGAEVGADAYIVKSSFDQSNLLEVVRRLV